MSMIWKGTGQLAGWTIAMMGKRPAARFEGRLMGAASLPEGVERALKRAKKAADPAPPPEKKKAAKKAAPCHCPETPAPARRRKEPCAATGPAPKLLARKARGAKLFAWLAPARKPTSKKGGGLRYVGGWPNDDAAAAMAAAKSAHATRGMPAGVLYLVNDNFEVVKTATLGG